MVCVVVYLDQGSIYVPLSLVHSSHCSATAVDLASDLNRRHHENAQSTVSNARLFCCFPFWMVLDDSFTVQIFVADRADNVQINTDQ